MSNETAAATTVTIALLTSKVNILKSRAKSAEKVQEHDFRSLASEMGMPDFLLEDLTASMQQDEISYEALLDRALTDVQNGTRDINEVNDHLDVALEASENYLIAQNVDHDFDGEPGFDPNDDEDDDEDGQDDED